MYNPIHDEIAPLYTDQVKTTLKSLFTRPPLNQSNFEISNLLISTWGNESPPLQSERWKFIAPRETTRPAFPDTHYNAALPDWEWPVITCDATRAAIFHLARRARAPAYMTLSPRRSLYYVLFNLDLVINCTVMRALIPQYFFRIVF